MATTLCIRPNNVLCAFQTCPGSLIRAKLVGRLFLLQNMTMPSEKENHWFPHNSPKTLDFLPV